MMNETTLRNKVAIVTGAGRGHGEAIAMQLGMAGARVAVHDLNPDRAQAVADAITQAGGKALPITANISNKFQCVHLVEKTRAEWGQLDILVNSHHIAPSSTLLKLDEWQWNQVLEVNLKGTFMMCQLVGRVMSDENGERGGVMVNLAGTAGIDHAWEGQAAVCAGNAGILGFTRECAREYATYYIRVHNLLLNDQVPPTPDTIAQATLNICQHANSEQIIHLQS
jgi:NAD(P)-dependent dehydrogenase (short-subunit alcohol dehydrogenase family)